MDTLTPDTVRQSQATQPQQQPAGGAVRGEPRVAGDTGGAALEATYFAQVDEAGVELEADRIQVLVPGENGSFHALYQPEGRPLQRAIVRAPQLCVIPGGQWHRLSAQRATDMVVIGIDPAFFEARSREAFGSPRQVTECYGAVDAFLRGFGNALRAAFRSGAAPTAEYLESMAAAVATHVATHYHASAAPALPHAGLAPHRLQRVLACIEERLAEAIQVKDLADLVHMSPFHFARMFKLATGLPPHAYITMQRMEQAKALLAHSELTLVEVAAQVGYQTQAHFTGVFHRHVGTTPRVFRLKSRDGSIPA